MKKLLSLIAALALFAAGCAAQEAPVRRSVTGFYFDTVITISAYVSSEALLKEALDACADYERLLSKTVEGSDVWNINHAGGQPVEVSDDTLSILSIARQVSEWSGGAFDVTVAPAVALWDFTGGGSKVPDAAAIAAAAERIDYTKVSVDGNRVTLPEGMQIDLGGVAKGYIADRIADLVKAKGIEDALLNFGGNVIALGKKPDGALWTVGIQDPDESTGTSLLAVKASGLSVVTSGIYERGFDLDGVRYHHLLDPKTGWPMQNGLASATIFCESSGLADALSTATFVLGLEEGMALIENTPGAEALFITREGGIFATDGAEALIVR